jgi:hypothetical protein
MKATKPFNGNPAATVMSEAMQGILEIVADLDHSKYGWRDMDATDVDQHLGAVWRLARNALKQAAENAA